MPSIGRSIRQRREPASPLPAPSSQADQQNSIAVSQYLLDRISSFEKFAPDFLRIQTKDGQLVDFEMNEVQALLEEIRKYILSKGRLFRVVILKARRKGVTTLVSGRFFWKTVTAKNRYSTIITHEPEATDFVFKMHKRFQENLPDWFRPSERYNNKRILEFNNDAGSGLDSAIRVGTAGKEDLGSAQLIHYLHLSELAKWPRHTSTNLLLSLFQTVPDILDSEIIIESTAKGVGGEFYDRYWGSRYQIEVYVENGIPRFREKINEDSPEDNEFTSIFIPWFAFREYRRPVEGLFVRTKDEEDLVKAHGLTDEQLAWRRWTITNKCDGKLELFNQEYPDTAENAFLSSSDNVFDLVQLKALRDAAVPPIARYDIHTSTGNWVVGKEGKLRVWQEPIAFRKYVVVGDPAEGLNNSDFSCLDVIDCLTGMQVAQWHGHIAPDTFGIISYYLGLRYNTALIAIERNNHGITTLDKLIDLRYRHIYAETVIDPPNKPRRRYGWLSTKASKPRVIDSLLAEMRDLTHGIKCRETFEEMMFFKQFEDGTLGAEIGQHDDRVITIAVGKYIISKLPRKNRVEIPNSYTHTRPSTESGLSGITPESWT